MPKCLFSPRYLSCRVLHPISFSHGLCLISWWINYLRPNACTINTPFPALKPVYPVSRRAISVNADQKNPLRPAIYFFYPIPLFHSISLSSPLCPLPISPQPSLFCLSFFLPPSRPVHSLLFLSALQSPPSASLSPRRWNYEKCAHRQSASASISRDGTWQAAINTYTVL